MAGQSRKSPAGRAARAAGMCCTNRSPRPAGGAGHELSVIYGRLGQQVPSSDQGQGKRPDNYAGRILAAIFTSGI